MTTSRDVISRVERNRQLASGLRVKDFVDRVKDVIEDNCSALSPAEQLGCLTWLRDYAQRRSLTVLAPDDSTEKER